MITKYKGLVEEFDLKTISEMMQIELNETEEYLNELNNSKLSYDVDKKQCNSLSEKNDEYKIICEKVKKSVNMFNSILAYATHIESCIKEVDESKYKEYQDVKDMVENQKQRIHQLSGNKDKAVETLK